jgi:myo-inositol-1(or 4)-monophosphatase
MKDRQPELMMAIEASRLAGSLLSTAARNMVLCNDGRDLKHQADRDAEQTILAYLSDHSAYSILTEESGVHGFLGEGPMWVVDPLDGTLNFSRSCPFCCVSIALWKDDQPLLGVVYDFNRGELFSGIAGKGAWMNDVPIRVSAVQTKDKAILATGFPTFSDFSDNSLQSFIRQVQQYKKVRLFGAAALSLAYVACGRVDAYMENDIMLWDVAAGAALVAAAGGAISVNQSERGQWMRRVVCGANESLV